MSITIGRLRGGLCAIWHENGKRHRHQLKARTRKEAEAEALDVYRKHTQPVGSATVRNCWEAYQSSLEGRPTGRTLSYTGIAVLGFFGMLRPEHIGRDTCSDYADQRRGEGVNTGTVHTELGHLRSALRYAAKIGLIDKAPYIWLPTKPEKDKRILNAGEARNLIDSCEGPHVRLAVILLLGTAGRVGAILDLDWSRVDFERGSINLRLSDSQTRVVGQFEISICGHLPT